LSCEPVFSKEVQYAPEKYRYEPNIAYSIADFKDEPKGGDLENKVNALTWDFSRMYDDYKTWLVSGDYHGFIKAVCNVMYDNLLWEVEIAKSKRFSFSL
jgi:hypothetical protein